MPPSYRSCFAAIAQVLLFLARLLVLPQQSGTAHSNRCPSSAKICVAGRSTFLDVCSDAAVVDRPIFTRRLSLPNPWVPAHGRLPRHCASGSNPGRRLPLFAHPIL